MEADLAEEVREESELKEYIHSICMALGGFEKVTDPPASVFTPNPSRRQLLTYVVGDECLECLKDLRKLLRQEEKSLVKPVRLLLAEWNTFSEDFLPILALHPDFMDDKLGRTCFELVAYLMTPVVCRPFSNNLAKEVSEQEEIQVAADTDAHPDEAEVDGLDSGDELSDEEYGNENESGEDEAEARLSAVIAIKEHRHHQLRYKNVILKNRWIFTQVMIQIEKLLRNSGWHDEDERFLFTVLTFVKSLLTLEAPQEDKTFNIITSQDTLLECLQSSQMLDFLLSLMGSIQEPKFTPYAPLATDIVFCLFRHVDLDHLLASLQPDGTVADTKPADDPLTEHARAESGRTLNDVFTNPTRHSRFGGTNTFYMNKGHQPYLFSPDAQPLKLPQTGVEFAKLRIGSAEDLLKLLKLGKRETLRKRPRFRVDEEHHHAVLYGGSKRILLGFAYQYTRHMAVSMFTATQRFAVGATTDDRGREAFVLMLVLRLATAHLGICGDWGLVRALLPLLAGPSLSHYLMSAISEFKDGRCFKALAVALKAFQAWLELLMDLQQILEGLNPDSDSESFRVAQKLEQVGKHQLHNFVHDYALMRPLHDLFSGPTHHPFLLPALIPATYHLNRAVKRVLLHRSGSAFARLKAPPKRPKKRKAQAAPHPPGKRHAHPSEPSTESAHAPSDALDQSPSKLSQGDDSATQQLEAMEQPNDPKDALADALFSDNDELVQAASQEEASQEEDSSDSQSEAKRYLRSYTSDNVMRCLLVYTDSALSGAASPSALYHQPKIHEALDRKLKMSTAIMHQLVVRLGCIKLLHKAVYLHAIYAFGVRCREIRNAFLLPDRRTGLVCELPPTLQWVGELEKLSNYVFHAVLISLKKDPWLLATLLPKSASKAVRRALVKPATSPPEDHPNRADPPREPAPKPAASSPPSSAAIAPPIPNGTARQEDFDDEFLADLFV
ncbi:Topoisomerase 1-associated factor 1 [Massospora cicadina]|nr:Topoisomerase 1-associated factor 1 [Massospora cicadina]